MIETKNYRKTIQFYQKLLQKERRNKGKIMSSMPVNGSDGSTQFCEMIKIVFMCQIYFMSLDSEIKTKLLKLKGELQEMKSKVQFLETVKKYLQVSQI